MASLSIRKLSKAFGALPVLKGIDLEVADREFLVLVGPSGCGKSTLLAMIAGLEKVSAGEIAIGGRVVNRVPPKDRNIAMVFQSYALYPTMTARQNMTFGMECRGVPKAEQQAALVRVAGLLQIEHLLDRRPAQLSGGQRQRVAMGRALVRNPELFLFDEPLSNLDAKLRVEMRTEIKKLHQRLGTTVVYVTHDQVEAMTLATRIAVMRQGEIQQLAAPRTVYERPANLFVAGFMGSPAMNFVKGQVRAAAGRPEIVIGEVRLPLSMGMAHLRPWLDREVVLGIRPEHIVHAGHHRATQGNATGSFEAKLEVVEPTGAETMVVIHLGGHEVIARLEPDQVDPVGSRMRFAVDMAKACLFDPATEQLI